jgi:16S rRNA (guanine527-N7)-methyltransferase
VFHVKSRVPGGEIGDEVAALCERYALRPRASGQLLAILECLAADALAPTTVRDPGPAVLRHLADSLVALEFDQVCAARAIADIGAGAGFPGMPLAVALPESAVWLVESQRRKCDFVDRALRAAEIENASSVHVRAEEWRAGFGRQDVVLARALARQPVVLEYAAPLLADGGTLVDWRGRRDPADESNALAAACELGLRRLEVRRVEPYAAARDHHLHLYAKVAPTPTRFPRRPGVARKRPLGC